MSDAANSAVPARPAGSQMIAARLDRLPFSGWHARVLALVSLAHLSDTFGLMSIAFVLPVLIQHWSLTTVQAGGLVSVGYVGQFVGAIAAGWAAERMGRRQVLCGTVAGLSLLSLASAFAPSFSILAGLRFVQGIALGGEAPVAATYINELAPRRLRGRIIFALQLTVGVGVLFTGVVALWLVPRLGWRAMFAAGALPLILSLLLPVFIPESPRWLSTHGREREAEEITAGLEHRAGGVAALAAPEAVSAAPITTADSTLSALLSPRYRRRTLSVWVVMAFISLSQYGLIAWLPTLYTMFYGLSVQQSLRYSVAMGFSGICGSTLGFFLIDRIGRRRTFLLGFLGSAAPLLWLGSLGVGGDAFLLMTLTTVCGFFGVLVLSGIYVYAPEIYPTHLRALGTGVGTAWIRIGAILSPALIGWALPHTGVANVFLGIAGAALAGALGTYLLVIETRGRSLEELGGA